mmetsp:Transcript_20255/g.45067  ORF Transcript_20255/g.45067 Transcript_20255/m.45067 type:complete len:291 (-) Transcript_20255:24-896(-)
MRYKDLLLLGACQLQGLANQPRTFGIFNVCSNLPQNFRRGECVKNIILDLEVLTKTHAHSIRLTVEIGLWRIATIGKGKGAAQVERVVACLVSDTALVAVQGEARKVKRSALSVGIRGAVGVDVLPNLGLEGRVDEELEELNVGGMRLEVATEGLVDEDLKEQSVVDGIVLRHVRVLVPAWGAAASNATIHDIVGDEEEGLKPLDLPPKDGGIEEFLLRQSPTLEDFDALYDGEATGHFSPRDSGLETLAVIRRELLLETIRQTRQVLKVANQLLLELIEHLQEGFPVGG